MLEDIVWCLYYKFLICCGYETFRCVRIIVGLAVFVLVFCWVILAIVYFGGFR